MAGLMAAISVSTAQELSVMVSDSAFSHSFLLFLHKELTFEVLDALDGEIVAS